MEVWTERDRSRGRQKYKKQEKRARESWERKGTDNDRRGLKEIEAEMKG